MQIRLLAVDLDGTLLDSRWQLSGINLRALREAYSRGVQVAFVTGRRYIFTQPYTSAFEFPHFVITNAGAATRSSSGVRMFRHPLKPHVVGNLLQFAKVFRPWMFLIFDRDGLQEVICESPHVANPHVARYLGLNAAYVTTVAELETEVDANLLQIALMGHLDEMREAARTIESFPEKSELNVLRTEYPARDFALLDVIDSSIHKGHALRELAASIGIAREEIMAIGDNHNDLDMLSFAGLPVVMGNAQDDLKTFGWAVTGTNDSNGVAEAVERFILS